MSARILYIGGTGEVSFGCVQAGAELGQDITVFNRGKTAVPLPQGIQRIEGDADNDEQYFALARRGWDVVCQFRNRQIKQLERDIQAFSGHVGQYIFISSASVYKRPPIRERIIESDPLDNPYSEYSTRKIEMEKRLMELQAAGTFKVTIVRPNHTSRTVFPRSFILGDEIAWRMVKGKPIISHGDGTSLWTITRTEDFGRAFAKLAGNPAAMGQAFHIASDRAYSWDDIYAAMAKALGAGLKLVHVSSDTLARYDKSWESSLAGDKSFNIAFDNTKIKQAVGGWECRYDLHDFVRLAAPHVMKRMQNFSPDPQADALMDRVADEQSRLGNS